MIPVRFGLVAVLIVISVGHGWTTRADEVKMRMEEFQEANGQPACSKECKANKIDQTTCKNYCKCERNCKKDWLPEKTTCQEHCDCEHLTEGMFDPSIDYRKCDKRYIDSEHLFYEDFKFVGDKDSGGVTFKIIGANGLPDLDKKKYSKTTDPFVEVIIKTRMMNRDEVVKNINTSTVPNHENPKWFFVNETNRNVSGIDFLLWDNDYQQSDFLHGKYSWTPEEGGYIAKRFAFDDGSTMILTILPNNARDELLNITTTTTTTTRAVTTTKTPETKCKIFEDAYEAAKKKVEELQKAVDDANNTYKAQIAEEMECESCMAKIGYNFTLGNECILDCDKEYVMCPGSNLSTDVNLTSANGNAVFTMKSDGNLVIYKIDGGERTAVWETVTDYNEGLFKFDHDYSTMLYPHTAKTFQETNKINVTESHTSCDSSCRIIIQDDCNLVLYMGVKKVLWETGSTCKEVET